MNGVYTKRDVFFCKKRFGQNFLIDKNILREIVAHAKISKLDSVLEIGPGQGALSNEILDAGCQCLHAIEIDKGLLPWLEPIGANRGSKFKLHLDDAVKFDYSKLDPFPNKVVANIPYNITTPLIHKLIRYSERGLKNFVLTVQLEAAQKLAAAPDTKERYPLGVTLEAMGSVKILRRVPRTCFRPPPNVESCVIEINLEKNFELGGDENWNAFLHAGFRQRRKMLVNNLKGFGDKEISDWTNALERLGIDKKIRAEDLEWQEWLSLYGDIMTSPTPQPPPSP